LILLFLTEPEVDKNKAKLKRQANLDRHSPKPIANVCYLPDSPPVSLETNFKGTVQRDGLGRN
jgi:hypothetical protein